MASSNTKRVVTIFGLAIVGGLILDNWAGTNALAATGFTGVSNLSSTLRSGTAHPTTPKG
jgi:hypothetical protein